ncbi:MAG TPA: hypothetical protein VGJ20_18480 [Xanthobacteraceae bacterium]|jgi:hypothetical protein
MSSDRFSDQYSQNAPDYLNVGRVMLFVVAVVVLLSFVLHGGV